MGGLEAKLLAASLKRGLPVAGDWLTAELRERGVLPESDAETVFVDTLREEFEAAAQRATGDASEVLYSVALNWDAVETRLATIDTAFETEEEAVAGIVDRIESAEAVTLRVTEKETLQRVVARAYRETVDSYGERLADSGFAEAFQVEANLQLSEQIREVCGRLDEIADRAVPTERFDWYDPTDPAAVESVVDRIVETERASFVDRPELDGVPDAERLLVVGAAGSGKSRVLGEAVERVADAGRVSQIVTPRRDLVSHRDEWAFEYETFDGDVLLVWDDVHEITEDGNPDAFQSAVSTLERVLDEQGHDLHVVAAVRSGNVADLPGVESVDSIRRKPSGLWEPFAVIELGELDESRLGEIASQRARIHEVAFADDDARQTLVEKSRGPSAPEYIDAVIRTQGDSEDDPEASVVVTETDVADTPDSISDIWYEQFYDVLDDRDQRAVLKACKLWYDLGIPYVAPLVRAVWTEVLDRPGGKTAFKRAVNSLVERKWVALAGDSPLDDETLLWMHDTQCDAVAWEWTDRIPDISAALRNEDQYLTDDDNELFVRAGGQFANGLRHVERETTDVRETHYERLLPEVADADAPLDFTNIKAYNNYANQLKEAGKTEKAEEHYKRALVETADTDDPLDSILGGLHSNYANLLREQKRTEKAEQHYERALEETADTDDPLDSTFAEAHYNYGQFLETLGDHERAVEHCERAIEVASELGDSDREREFRELYATLDGRELEDRVREQYTFGLQAVQRHDWETAGDLLPSVWELHEAFESQDPPYWMTLAAGVWCRVILDAGGITANEDVDEQILSALVADTSLSPVAEELYSYYSATEWIRAPQFFAGSNEADDRDGETTALVKQAELDAYQTLYDFL
jgi:tetratricopeptide (TPR) repeat protein